MTFDPEVLPVPDLGLQCKKCAYSLADLPEHRCPECGTPFNVEDHIPAGDFPVVIFNGKEAYCMPDVLGLLKRVQIPYMEVMRPGETMLGAGGATHNRCRLAVPRASYFEVIDLLRRQALGEEPPGEVHTEQPDWTCKGCGESNPGNFETCWNCGNASPA